MKQLALEAPQASGLGIDQATERSSIPNTQTPFIQDPIQECWKNQLQAEEHTRKGSYVKNETGIFRKDKRTARGLPA